jgi:hypothetical protein
MLQDETKARPRRRVEIINLGLEPWEAIGMGLPVETIERDSVSVAGYVTDRTDGEHWRQWLQGNRVELNAMSTPDFIKWLDAKMVQYRQGKVIPPVEVIAEKVEDEIAERLRHQITERVLREANFDSLVADAIAGTDIPDIDPSALQDWLSVNDESLWTAWAAEQAKAIVEAGEKALPRPAAPCP